MSIKKENKPSSLWFIAILPPEPILTEVKAFKEHARDHFDSAHALRSPAHVTLFPPFRFAEKNLTELDTLLKEFAYQQQSFELELSNFNCFAPRVVYVDVPHSSTLSRIQHSLRDILKSKLQLPYPGKHEFHPHMTIAFRDLRKSKFRETWAYFSKQHYQRSFPVKAISLLKHQGKGWALYKNYFFDPQV